MTDNPGSDPALDAVTIGETLATFIRAETPTRYELTAVGAESNVAIGMAQLGCRTRWVSRLGADELGRFVHDHVAGHGVDLQVAWDDERPTGILVKEIGEERTRVRYYRSQSAARGLGPTDLHKLGGARWIHVTGVTAALSDSSAALVSAIVAQTELSARVSFDVNYRPALWPSAAAAAEALLPLARQADLVFIGYDEAEALLGTSSSEELAARILTREDQELVVKRGGGPASVITRDAEVSEPAHEAAIVDLTGAGDAFAAGYLSGACRGLRAADRLRQGHALAARVVTVRGDIAERLQGLDEFVLGQA
jgi:2-dehydro-3-deoxygluconokinase